MADPMRFTVTSLKALKPESSRYEVPELNGKGLRIRVYPSGRKSFVYRYRYGAKSGCVTLGEFADGEGLADAHLAHAEARGLLKKGVDPATVRKAGSGADGPEAGTVAELMHEYIEHHAKPKKKTWEEDKRMLEADVLPAWGHRQAREITRRDVVMVLDAVGKRGPGIRARVRSTVSMMFRIGMRRGLVDANPAADMERSDSKPRERVLTDGEIARIWHGIDATQALPAAKYGLKLLLATAQRKGELVRARWADLDLEAGTWSIPAEHAKNGQAHRVPLSPLAVDLFRGLKGTTEPASPFVMTSVRMGKPTQYGSTSFSNLPKQVHHFGLPHWTLHDLRRTASTRMRAIPGVDPMHVERVLNHLPPMLVRTYDRHDYQAEMRRAVEAWGEQLAQIVGGEPRCA